MRLDYLAYPASSFPFRDLLVLEQLSLGPDDRACEIGVGSGETSARLARLCRDVVGVDVSAPAIASIRYLESRHPNLRLRVADVTRPEHLARLDGGFTRVVSCDTLEHVADPRAYFAAIHRCLAPGGRALVTFPNEPRDRMHGITRFDSPEELRAIVEASGLGAVRLGAARLTPHAARVADRFGFRPVRALRRAQGRLEALRPRRRVAGPRADGPKERFDETRFHRWIGVWTRIAPLVNAYWRVVLGRMTAKGPCFAIDWGFGASDFGDCQVVIEAARPIEAVASTAPSIRAS